MLDFRECGELTLMLDFRECGELTLMLDFGIVVSLL